MSSLIKISHPTNPKVGNSVCIMVDGKKKSVRVLETAPRDKRKTTTHIRYRLNNGFLSGLIPVEDLVYL